LIIRWPLVGGTRPRSVARGGQDRQRTRSCRPSRGDADVGQGQASARGFCLGLPSQHLTGASRTNRSARRLAAERRRLAHLQWKAPRRHAERSQESGQRPARGAPAVRPSSSRTTIVQESDHRRADRYRTGTGTKGSNWSGRPSEINGRRGRWWSGPWRTWRAGPGYCVSRMPSLRSSASRNQIRSGLLMK
jgi:hypothetical protein